MAGIYGTFSKFNDFTIPETGFYLNNKSNFINTLEKDEFHLVHFKNNAENKKFGIVKNGEVISGYVGYIQNLEDLYTSHVKENVFEESTALGELYIQCGDKIWEWLNGNYVALAYNIKTKETSIISDRLGTFPIYYTVESYKISFSSSMLGLASVQFDEPELDLQATADFLSFGYALNKRTLIKGINLLENATVLKYKNGKLSTRKYWSPNFSELNGYRDKNELAQALNEHIDQAVNRFCSDRDLGLAMSAGLDSRHIAARIPDKIRLGVVNGNPKSYEVKGAKEVCCRLCIPLNVSHYKTHQFKETNNLAIISNDGLINTPEFLFVSKMLSVECNVGIVGAYGNGIRGQIGPDLKWEYKNFEDAKRGLCKAANREYIRFSEAQNAYGPIINKKLLDSSIQTFQGSFERINSDQPYNAALWQDVYYRNMRRIFPALGVGRRFIEIRFPFTDNALVEFAYSIPWKIKVNKDLYRKGFILRYPELSKIANQLGQNYIYESKFGRIREIKRKFYLMSPNKVKYFLKPFLPKHSNTANRDVYNTSLKEETIQRLIALSNHKILKRSFVDKLLKNQFKGLDNRYPLMHRLYTLSNLIDGFEKWNGIKIL